VKHKISEVLYVENFVIDSKYDGKLVRLDSNRIQDQKIIKYTGRSHVYYCRYDLYEDDVDLQKININRGFSIFPEKIDVLFYIKIDNNCVIVPEFSLREMVKIWGRGERYKILSYAEYVIKGIIE
jgi:hypothetical protein